MKVGVLAVSAIGAESNDGIEGGGEHNELLNSSRLLRLPQRLHHAGLETPSLVQEHTREECVVFLLTLLSLGPAYRAELGDLVVNTRYSNDHEGHDDGGYERYEKQVLDGMQEQHLNLCTFREG